MVVVPAAIAVTIPDTLTEAIAGLSLVQIAPVVTSDVPLPLKYEADHCFASPTTKEVEPETDNVEAGGAPGPGPGSGEPGVPGDPGDPDPGDPDPGDPDPDPPETVNGRFPDVCS